MGLTVVNIGTNTSTSGASVALTIGAAGVPAGVTIFVHVTEKSTSGTNGTLADTAGNSYSTLTSGSLAATAADGRGILFAVNQSKALVNTNTITYTKNLSGANAAISAYYVIGVTAAATFTEGLATATGTTGTITVTSGTIGRGDLIVGGLFDSGSTAAGAAATFTNATNFVTPPNEANSGTAASGNARVDGGTNTQASSGTVTYNPTLSSTAQQWFLSVLGAIPAWVPNLFEGSWDLPIGTAIARAAAGPGVAIALMASGPFAPPVEPAVNECAFQGDAFQFTPLAFQACFVTNVDEYYIPLSEPVRVAPRDAWFQDQVSEVRTQSDVTGIKYLPLSEPVRTPPRASDFPDRAFVPIVQQDLVTSWYVPLSEPVRTKPIDAWFQEYTKGTQPAVSFSYYLPLTEPVRVPPRDVWFQDETLTRTASDVTGIQYLPLSEPVRTPPRDAWFQPDVLGQPQSDVTGIKYLPLSEPVRTPLRDVWYQDATSFVAIAPFPETVTEPRWHQPWSEPVRVLPRDAWFQPVVVEEIQPVVSFSYYLPLSEPVRVPPRDAWFQPDTLTRTASDVTGLQYLPLSEPVRIPPRDTWFQPDTIGRPATDATGIKYLPLSEPVRVLPRATEFQPVAFVAIVQQDTIDNWYPPFSDPVRTPPRSADFPAIAFTQIVQQDTVDSWYVPLSDPVRVPLRDAWFQDLTFYPLPIPQSTITVANWFEPFTDPVRVAPRTAWYQDETFVAVAPFPETVTEPRWHQPWSEPVRVLPRDVWFQPDVLARPASDVTGLQYLPLSEPVRVSPRSADFPALDFVAVVQQTTVDSWYVALTDPVRVALRDAWYQDATSISPFQISTAPSLSWSPVFPDRAPAAARVVYNQELAFVVGAVVPTTITSLQSWEPWVDPPPPLPIIALREGWPTYIDTTDLPPTDTGKVWRRYWIQADPDHVLNRDAPHDLVWTDEDDVITVTLLL